MFRRMNPIPNGLSINSRKTYNELGCLDRQTVEIVFDFAYSMIFGKVGEHRPYRSGGQQFVVIMKFF